MQQNPSAVLAGDFLLWLCIFLSIPVLAQDRSLKVWFGRDNFTPEDKFAAFRAENPDIAVEFETIRLGLLAAVSLSIFFCTPPFLGGSSSTPSPSTPS